MQEAFPAVVTPYLPLIIVHIAAGVIAILTGYVAVLVRKGDRKSTRLNSSHRL